MTQLIDGMQKIEAAQERIGRHLGGAQDVPPSVDLRLAETEQLLHPPAVIAPDPAMYRSEHPIETCR